MKYNLKKHFLLPKIELYNKKRIEKYYTNRKIKGERKRKRKKKNQKQLQIIKCLPH